MNITQIEENVQQLIKPFQKDTFIYDLLLAYGQPKASITRLQKGGLNLSKNEGEILWKKKLFFKTATSGDLQTAFNEAKKYDKALRQKPRFIIVTDHVSLLAYDTKTDDDLDCTLAELPKHFDFFLPMAGMEKAQHQNENPADVKAAERMAKLYDEIKKDNPTDTPEAVHSLNVFLSRLLFCFFAEDTGIFTDNQFTNAISSHTDPDGSDLHTYLDQLFEVMNTEPKQRHNLPAYLDAFPWVNGGLFRNQHHAPVFSRKSRQAIIDGGELQWKDINPDIFGSMIQAVITPEHRGGLGMHYTSVPNIMKVIEPLFLDDLKEEFAAAKGHLKKLNDLLLRLWNIKIFDPACGSGNFLIIAYKELRKLEMQVFQEIDRVNQSYSNQFSGISLSRFYGIELDDFAHEVAMLSLWLAEHQMNQAFFKTFGRTKPPLPLQETGNIVHGNACRLDWEEVCPKGEGDEIFVLGNPPYLGASIQTKEQKYEMEKVFSNFKGYKNLDYIACWFWKGAKFIQKIKSKCAFVSTNSICQGEQVGLLWPNIFQLNIEIGFAYTSFKWKNNAKGNAGVSVVIIGLRNSGEDVKRIFLNGITLNTYKISPYLTSGSNIIVNKRSSPLSNLNEMIYGSKPVDGGNLILDEKEKEEILKRDSTSEFFIKKFTGSHEFINGVLRYCLWITDSDFNKAIKNEEILKRIDFVRRMRLASPKKATRELAMLSHKFGEIRHEESNSIIVIPSVSSEKREYIPVGFLNSETIVSNLAFTIQNAEPFLLSLLTSKLHNLWVHAVAGRLEERIRYSSTLCYNTFPFPPISDAQKQTLEAHVYRILEEREAHSEKTLAQLYDPDKMPAGLREAHHQNDLAVERCYRSRPFGSDEERLEYLFKLYERMIAEEQEKGTLFAGEGKKKKGKGK